MAADESEFHMMGSDPSKELILTDYDKKRKIPKPKDDGFFQITTRTLATELCCPICLDLLTNTMTTKECLHRFCAECITTALLRGNKECPSCRKKLVSKRSLRPDPNFDALIAKMWPDRRLYEEMQSRCEKEFDSHGSHSQLSPAKRPRLDDSLEGEPEGSVTPQDVSMESEPSSSQPVVEKPKEEPGPSGVKPDDARARSQDSAETVEALESPEGQARREAMERLEQMEWPEEGDEESQRKSSDSGEFQDWREEDGGRSRSKEKSKSPKENKKNDIKKTPEKEKPKQNGTDEASVSKAGIKDVKKECNDDLDELAQELHGGDCTCGDECEIVELEVKDGKVVLDNGMELILKSVEEWEASRDWKAAKKAKRKKAKNKDTSREPSVKKEIKQEANEHSTEQPLVNGTSKKNGKDDDPHYPAPLASFSGSEAELAAYEAMKVDETVTGDDSPLLPEGTDPTYLDDLEAQLFETDDDEAAGPSGTNGDDVQPGSSGASNGTSASINSVPGGASNSTNRPLFDKESALTPTMSATMSAASVLASISSSLSGGPSHLPIAGISSLKLPTMPLIQHTSSQPHNPSTNSAAAPSGATENGEVNGNIEGPSDPPSADSSASPTTPTTNPVTLAFPEGMTPEMEKDVRKEEELLEEMDDDELLRELMDIVDEDDSDDDDSEEEEEESLGEDSTDGTISSDASGASVYSSTPPGSHTSSRVTVSSLTDSEPSQPPQLTPIVTTVQPPAPTPPPPPPPSIPSPGSNTPTVGTVTTTKTITTTSSGFMMNPQPPFVSTVFPPLPQSGYAQGLPPGLPGLGAPPFAPPDIMANRAETSKPSATPSSSRDDEIKPPVHTTPLKDRLHRWLADHPDKPPTPDQRMHEPLKRTVEEDEEVRDSSIGTATTTSNEDWTEIEVELLPTKSLLQRQGVCPDLTTPRYIRTRDETTMEHVSAFIHQKALEDAQARQSDFDAPPVPDIPRPEYFFAFSAEGAGHVRRLFLNETLLSASSAFTRHEHLIIFFDTKAPTLTNPRSVVELVVPEHFLTTSTAQ